MLPPISLECGKLSASLPRLTTNCTFNCGLSPTTLIQTSLNSGFKVLFLIWVLHLAFFPMSGFRKLLMTELNQPLLQVQIYNMNVNAILIYLHFDIGVRVSIRVHGSQMDTAHDAHNEAALLSAVHEGDQNAPALLYLSAFFPWLHSQSRGGGEWFRGVILRFVWTSGGICCI